MPFEPQGRTRSVPFGTSSKTTNDLPVTETAEPLKVGDTVVVTGQVALNKHFGPRDRHEVNVEGAREKLEAGGS